MELLFQRDGVDKSDGLRRFLNATKVLPIADALDIAAKEKVRLRLAGTPCEDNFDLLIGCTAIANDFVCVTDNVKHFKNFKGIVVENWIVRESS